MNSRTPQDGPYEDDSRHESSELVQDPQAPASGVGVNGEIQFGDLEQTLPQARLRPDQNKHYAVQPYGAPRAEELAIFVDLDVMRDMEAHAQTDTSVELGGVMLGGQFIDEQGKSFVVVTDSLRAEHFESTKGSFKFTHDTWAEITRQRDEFPDELQMVGWYHTHPDWGVFLSAMDMFICDHFFNKSLDIALVIDPCRADRGMFQWTGDSHTRIRRTGGFYLVSSRFRWQELDFYCKLLEGKITMASDPRYSGFGQAGPYPAPVVNVAGGQPAWQGMAVVGMLAVQFCLLMLLAWKMLVPLPAVPPTQERQRSQLAKIDERLDELVEVRRQAARSEAQLAVLDQAMSELKGTPRGTLQTRAEQQQEIEQLRAAIHGHRALEKDLEGRLTGIEARLRRAEKDAQYETSRLKNRIDDISRSYKRIKEENESLSEENDQFRHRLGLSKRKTSDQGEPTGLIGNLSWTGIGLIGAVAAALIVAIIFTSLSIRRGELPDQLPIEEVPAEPAESAGGDAPPEQA